MLWMLIQDVVGPAHLWPHFILRLYWSRNLTHWDRIMVATFALVNSLAPGTLMEWVQLRGMARDGSAIRHFHALIRYDCILLHRIHIICRMILYVVIYSDIQKLTKFTNNMTRYQCENYWFQTSLNFILPIVQSLNRSWWLIKYK